MGLLAVQDHYDIEDVLDNAIQYLLNDFDKYDQKFYDVSVVGTGHRGTIYLQYPSYAYSFPLIALSRYLKSVS